MKSSQLKPNMFFIGAFLLLLSVDALAQSDASSLDVVEVETEVGRWQIKPSSVVDQRVIKSSVDSTNDKKPTRKEQKDSSSWSLAGDVSQPSGSGASSVMDVSQPLVNKQPSASEDELADLSSADALPVQPVETITDDQIVSMSASLRKLIEENAKLKKDISDFDQQLRVVRGQQKLDGNRLNEVVLERDALKKQNENIILQGSQAEKNLQKLQQELVQKEEESRLKIIQLQTELAKKLQNNSDVQGQVSLPVSGGESSLSSSPAQRQASISVDVASFPTADAQSLVNVGRSTENKSRLGSLSDTDVKKRSEKILLALNTVSDEKKKLMRDEARVHYNMGNIYYNQGIYAKAASEYTRALELTPEDANAHYNLAFVAGDFLNDPKVALEHYRQYLFFSPGAQDAQMVRQKIIEAEIAVRGDINFETQINEELRKKKNGSK